MMYHLSLFWSWSISLLLPSGSHDSPVAVSADSSYYCYCYCCCCGSHYCYRCGGCYFLLILCSCHLRNDIFLVSVGIGAVLIGLPNDSLLYRYQQMKDHYATQRNLAKDIKREKITMIWSFKRKRHPDGTLDKHKARLCCHDGQKKVGSKLLGYLRSSGILVINSYRNDVVQATQSSYQVSWFCSGISASRN